MLEDDFARSSFPLFEEGVIDALEWTVDAGWTPAGVPRWAADLLDFFGKNERLYGHGLRFSVLSADGIEDRNRWLDRLREEVCTRKYMRFSEHFGFMRAGRFSDCAPLAVPYCPQTVEVGRENMLLLSDAASVPVGLENLAFAFGRQDVADQGAFIEDLLSPVDGFLMLDLHNIFCQSVNFDTPVIELLAAYPIFRAKQLHVSGGSYSQSSHQPKTRHIRRDTHDSAVPAELFELVPHVLKLCPNIDTVIFERLGNTIADSGQEKQFQSDFRRLKEACVATSECLQ